MIGLGKKFDSLLKAIEYDYIQAEGAKGRMAHIRIPMMETRILSRLYIPEGSISKVNPTNTVVCSDIARMMVKDKLYKPRQITIITGYHRHVAIHRAELKKRKMNQMGISQGTSAELRFFYVKPNGNVHLTEQRSSTWRGVDVRVQAPGLPDIVEERVWTMLLREGRLPVQEITVDWYNASGTYPPWGAEGENTQMASRVTVERNTTANHYYLEGRNWKHRFSNALKFDDDTFRGDEFGFAAMLLEDEERVGERETRFNSSNNAYTDRLRLFTFGRTHSTVDSMQARENEYIMSDLIDNYNVTDGIPHLLLNVPTSVSYTPEGSTSKVNPTNAVVGLNVVRKMIKDKLCELRNITYITPYRRHAADVRAEFRKYKNRCIVFDPVIATYRDPTGFGFVVDARRLCAALSRAQDMFIIIADVGLPDKTKTPEDKRLLKHLRECYGYFSLRRMMSFVDPTVMDEYKSADMTESNKILAEKAGQGCRNCGEFGHWKSLCTQPEKKIQRPRRARTYKCANPQIIWSRTALIDHALHVAMSTWEAIAH
ncbi:MAG: hypothetical protein Q9168_003091 [Polycauliona sp. 1 TL-2023]